MSSTNNDLPSETDNIILWLSLVGELLALGITIFQLSNNYQKIERLKGLKQ